MAMQAESAFGKAILAAEAGETDRFGTTMKRGERKRRIEATEPRASRVGV